MCRLAFLLALAFTAAAPGGEDARSPPAPAREKPRTSPPPPRDPDPDAELIEHLEEIEKLDLLLNLEFFEEDAHPPEGKAKPPEPEKVKPREAKKEQPEAEKAKPPRAETK